MCEDIIRMIAFRKNGGTLAEHMSVRKKAVRKKAWDREITVAKGASFEELFDKVMDLMLDTIPEYINDGDAFYYLMEDKEDISELLREVDTSVVGDHDIYYRAHYGHSEDDSFAEEDGDMDESLSVTIHVIE